MKQISNTTVVRLEILLRIWGVLSSNLGPETGYGGAFGGFTESLQASTGWIP
jgi:hypothetical protein